MFVATKKEESPYHPGAIAWFGYWDRKPTGEELLVAVQDIYGKKYDRETAETLCGFGPEQHQDEVADLAQLQRWFLCQAV